jgi:hypothetical protein
MKRQDFLEKISFIFQVNSVVAILGPRQCGKTTLARLYAEKIRQLRPENYFDLESMVDLQRLAKNPELVLSRLDGLIIIDEIQRMPDLFPTLRVLVDQPNVKRQFLILGSASRELIKQSSESLTGRISYLELTPFNFSETKELDLLWARGGFPKSYLSETDEVSFQWRKDYIRTFLEHDIPNLGFRIEPQNLQRFWMMLAHYHGNIFNASELGRSLGLSHNTIRSYADILTNTLMLRQLQPWHENISKRQVKSPKIYFRDSGILHVLLGIKNQQELWTHPKLGASWEGLALEELIRHFDLTTDCYFWSTHGHAELDLLIFKDGKRLGFEIKHAQAPKLTPSMRIALDDLHLDSLTVIYPGEKEYPLTENIYVVGLKKLLINPHIL